MARRWGVFAAFVLSLVIAPAAQAAVVPDILPDTTFPSGHDYFESLMADPKELNFGGTYLVPTHGDHFGEVNLGDYVGLLRWNLGSVGVQWNLAGGVNAQFDLSTPENDLNVVDFTAASPIDIHWGEYNTIRVGPWHTSSHLGDDYIRQNELTDTVKRSQDSMKAIYSFEPDPAVRLYGGGSYAFNTVNIPGHCGAQAGLELISPYYIGHQAQLYLAQDFQSWERSSWNPTYTARAGIRFSDQKRISAAQVYVEYFTGKELQLQFYDRYVSAWGIGLNFEIGNPTRE